jgi:PAS domain-containing protein
LWPPRFVRNERLIGALMAQVFTALTASPGVRIFYDALRARGIEHNDALRRLARSRCCTSTQRPAKTITRGGHVLRYVETAPADITLANPLAREVLGRSLDELAPGTGRLPDILHGYVTARSAVRRDAADEHPAVKRGCRPPVPQVGDDRLGDVAGKRKLIAPAAFGRSTLKWPHCSSLIWPHPGLVAAGL